MTTNAASDNIDVDSEMKINDNDEMMKCYTIEKMTPDEIAANPVKFNPMIVCVKFKMFLNRFSWFLNNCIVFCLLFYFIVVCTLAQKIQFQCNGINYQLL